MKKLIQFQMQFQEVEVREDKVVIIGYASTPTLDSYNTVVPVEVVQAGLNNYQKNPIILLQHDTDKPIGRATSREVDIQGRKVTAEVTKNTDGIMENIKEGIVKGFSIGFYAQGREYVDVRSGKALSEMTDDEKEDVPYTKIGRRFTEIEIRELSVVSVPANPDTLFTMKRAFKKFFSEYETRSVAMEERVILSDSENPFVKKPVIEEVTAPEVETEPTELTEDIVEDIVEEITPETAGTTSENEEIEQETVAPEPTTDEVVDNLQPVSNTDGNDGETPSTTPESNDQADKEELLEERALNGKLLEFVEELSKKYSALEARLGQVPVNKPMLYQRDAKSDPLVSAMIKAKGGF